MSHLDFSMHFSNRESPDLASPGSEQPVNCFSPPAVPCCTLLLYRFVLWYSSTNRTPRGFKWSGGELAFGVRWWHVHPLTGLQVDRELWRRRSRAWPGGCPCHVQRSQRGGCPHCTQAALVGCHNSCCRQEMDWRPGLR